MKVKRRRKTHTKTAVPSRLEIDSGLDNTGSHNPRTGPTTNRVFLTGVACVGKTTIGAELSRLLGYRFYDLDREVEVFYQLSIERLQNQHKSPNDFRKTAAKVLDHILSKPESCDCVIALPPAGLIGAYWKVVQRAGATTVVIHDDPQNILSRIVFFDIDSRPIEKPLSMHERKLYLREIKADVSYFRTSYRRATTTVDISGLNVEDSARKIKAALQIML